ncbi:hypothetical protein A7K91_12680 [Paenibacillus oryzae]|uniref:Uncharacterized protein n=1 Tax=Paenibacillus oryzae TaxID=1844972 RepID=A0A1A5YFF1_9BACL|nr:hypothetical protein A7K91_12680 [Paenibacillus oryzae]
MGLSEKSNGMNYYSAERTRGPDGRAESLFTATDYSDSPFSFLWGYRRFNITFLSGIMACWK